MAAPGCCVLARRRPLRLQQDTHARLKCLSKKALFGSLAPASLTFRYIALPAGAACFVPGCAEKAYNEGGTARAAAGITIGSVAAVHAYCDQLLEIAYKGEAKPKCR